MEALEKRLRLSKASQRLTEEISSLLTAVPEDGLSWQGTTTDLMAAIHGAYVTGRITTEAGNPMTFLALVRRLCGVLHRPVPRNPYHKAQKALMAKSIYRRPFMERYAHLLIDCGVSHPLRKEVRR